jgi:hypothetical protein
MWRIAVYLLIALLLAAVVVVNRWQPSPRVAAVNRTPLTRAAAAPPATRPADPFEDPEVEPRILKLIAQLADPDARVRDVADVLLRNQPVSAYPVFERVLAAVKDSLPAEASSRLGQYRQMYARLA